MFIAFRGGEMCLFLILFWCSSVLGDVQARRFFAINSRFGEVNSRLGRREFPVRSATGIGSQAIDLLCRFSGRAALAKVKSKKFSVRRETPESCPRFRDGPGAASRKTAPTSVARSDRPVYLPAEECSPQSL